MLKAKKPVNYTVKTVEKHDDKATEFFQLMLAYYFQYQRQVIAAIAAFVIIVAAVFLYYRIQSNSEVEAAELLSTAFPLYESKQYELALNGDVANNITGLIEISQNFGSTPSGTIASYLAGYALLQSGKAEEAKTYFDNVSSDNPYLNAAAIAGAATYHEEQKDYAKAGSLYENAASKANNKLLSSRYLHLAGINYALAGNTGDALDCFEELKEKYKETSYGKDADKYIALYSK